MPHTNDMEGLVPGSAIHLGDLGGWTIVPQTSYIVVRCGAFEPCVYRRAGSDFVLAWPKTAGVSRRLLPVYLAGGS